MSGANSLTKFSLLCATGYVLSGCFQPLLLTLCKTSGLADPKAQIYMFFYYLGPSCVIIPLLWSNIEWPKRTVRKAIASALFDIVAASMNYAGAAMAGPTIFAIIYSSVTIWTAVFSLLLLGRRMNRCQWTSVLVVFLGLVVTAADSSKTGHEVFSGAVLLLVGSAMHALTYVICEVLMTTGEEPISVLQNCGVQGLAAMLVFFAWQLVYTLPKWTTTVTDPMKEAGVSISQGLALLFLFAFVNLIHSITFYETLVTFLGGATSAGVFKGLQATLVFVLTHVVYCGRVGGPEMCFSRARLLSLVTVAGGVTSYSISTKRSHRNSGAGYSEVLARDELLEMPPE